MSEATAPPETNAERDSLDSFLGELTLRRALVSAVVILAAIIALSIGVGFWAAGESHPPSAHVEAPNGTTLTIEQPATDETFDWKIAAIFGTAVGTTLLALVTGLLAIGT